MNVPKRPLLVAPNSCLYPAARTGGAERMDCLLSRGVVRCNPHGACDYVRLAQSGLG